MVGLAGINLFRTTEMVRSGDEHVFIVRLWREHREIAGAPEQWRGRAKHMPSGDVRYFEDFDSLSRFMGSYVEDLPPSAVIERHSEP